MSKKIDIKKLNIKFEDKSCIIFGKGTKEREVYFSGKAKLHLNIEDELNIKAHLHKFRRTLATKAIDKVMAIEQV